MTETQPKPRFKHAKSLAVYTVAIFSFFLVLILLSFLAQRQRILNQEQEHAAEAQADFAASAMERFNQLQEESRLLVEQDASSHAAMTNINQQLELLQKELTELLHQQAAMTERLLTAEEENAALRESLAALEARLGSEPDESEE